MHNVEQASPTTSTNSWYMDVRKYLDHDIMPSHFSACQKRALKLKALSYQLVHGVLFRIYHNEVLLRSLEARNLEKVLHDLHAGPIQGHFAGNTTAHKVMLDNFYWPTLFKYAHAYTRKCSVFQRCAGRNKKSVAPLQPIAVEEPFQQWDFDIIEENFQHLTKQHCYILTTTDYFKRWIEAIPLKWVNDQELISFLQQNIISKFKIPTSLVLDNAKYFSSLRLYDFSLENGIILKHSTNYYPQGNGLVESMNKNMICIIEKTIFPQR